MKTILAAAIAVLALPLVANAQARCSESYGSVRCSDGYGGSYRYNPDSRSLSGFTGNGESVYGRVNSGGTFNGYVGPRFVSCNKWGCY